MTDLTTFRAQAAWEQGSPQAGGRRHRDAAIHLLAELARLAGRPTNREILERAQERAKRLGISVTTEQILSAKLATAHGPRCEFLTPPT